MPTARPLFSRRPQQHHKRLHLLTSPLRSLVAIEDVTRTRNARRLPPRAPTDPARPSLGPTCATRRGITLHCPEVKFAALLQALFGSFFFFFANFRLHVFDKYYPNMD
ncbi:uncharacterized protein LOC110431979 [Sorghum bicolor]|uniref:uncharacterized protein LOC110431979 n=1 Tax=Sorghum bicolor TaxID=4558 RepID=UPI000B425217|nr:uncharacterized protein LOC110431979 [Sorghum bicolor]|eukprot:XP_021307537.1 uncharacterized protein LOC110431979 [Sorghum bicolor]